VFFAVLSALEMCCEAGIFGGGHKKVIIHLPLKVKQHHHTHTVYKHIHHKEPEVESKLIGYTYEDAGHKAPEMEQHKFEGFSHGDSVAKQPEFKVIEQHTFEPAKESGSAAHSGGGVPQGEKFNIGDVKTSVKSEWKPAAAPAPGPKPKMLYTSAISSSNDWKSRYGQLYMIDQGQVKMIPSLEYGLMLRQASKSGSSNHGGIIGGYTLNFDEPPKSMVASAPINKLIGYTYGGHFDAHSGHLGGSFAGIPESNAYVPKPSYDAYLTTTYKHNNAAPVHVQAAPEQYISHEEVAPVDHGYSTEHKTEESTKAVDQGWQLFTPSQEEKPAQQQEYTYEEPQNEQQFDYHQQPAAQKEQPVDYQIQVQHPEQPEEQQHQEEYQSHYTPSAPAQHYGSSDEGDAHATAYSSTQNQPKEQNSGHAWIIGDSNLMIPKQAHGNEVEMKNFAAVQSILKEAMGAGKQEWASGSSQSDYEQIKSIEVPSQNYGGDFYTHNRRRSSDVGPEDSPIVESPKNVAAVVEKEKSSVKDSAAAEKRR
jgi:hypothetical protein